MPLQAVTTTPNSHPPAETTTWRSLVNLRYHNPSLYGLVLALCIGKIGQSAGMILLGEVTLFERYKASDTSAALAVEVISILVDVFLTLVTRGPAMLAALTLPTVIMPLDLDFLADYTPSPRLINQYALVQQHHDDETAHFELYKLEKLASQHQKIPLNDAGYQKLAELNLHEQSFTALAEDHDQARYFSADQWSIFYDVINNSANHLPAWQSTPISLLYYSLLAPASLTLALSIPIIYLFANTLLLEIDPDISAPLYFFFSAFMIISGTAANYHFNFAIMEHNIHAFCKGLSASQFAVATQPLVASVICAVLGFIASGSKLYFATQEALRVVPFMKDMPPAAKAAYLYTNVFFTIFPVTLAFAPSCYKQWQHLQISTRPQLDGSALLFRVVFLALIMINSTSTAALTLLGTEAVATDRLKFNATYALVLSVMTAACYALLNVGLEQEGSKKAANLLLSLLSKAPEHSLINATLPFSTTPPAESTLPTTTLQTLASVSSRTSSEEVHHVTEVLEDMRTPLLNEERRPSF